MKVGIMQPYFFPYLGYWQLLKYVDRFVVFDDVNYINRGWINRNRILVNGQPKYFNIPMLGASQNKLINEISVNNTPEEINRMKSILYNAYRKAPFYKINCDLLDGILDFETDNLAEFLTHSIFKIKETLEINTEIVISSNLEKNAMSRGEDKIIEICNALDANCYVNPIGGMELYSFDNFKKRNIDLRFLRMKDIDYKQFENDFQSRLSIIDVLMFNSVETVKEMLLEFDLIDEDGVMEY